MPKVSIIIPIFNVQEHLAKCIESCINQSLKDIEIILVDDKSMDNSLNIAMKYKELDFRIILLQNARNLGTFLARAEGIKRASGEYIIFLDADDYLMPNTAESTYNLAISNNADMVHFGIIHEPYNKYATLPKIYCNMMENEEIANEIIVKNLSKSWLIVCTRLFKANLVKDSLKELDMIKTNIIASEDSILFFVICLLAQKSIGIDEKFYIYSQNPNSISRVNTKEKLLLQIRHREYLVQVLDSLKDNPKLTKHKYFIDASLKLHNLLMYFICLSKRFLDKDDLGESISPYIKYSILCMWYMPRWQIFIKLLIYIFSFGYKKI